MKQIHQMQFIELSRLLGKFSPHIDIVLAKKLFEEYKKYLLEVYHKLPYNTLIVQKVKNLEGTERTLEMTKPGDFKTDLQQHTKEIIKELDNVTLSA